MSPNASTPKPRFKIGVFLFGAAQLGLGLMSANWAWGLWVRAERTLPASFWGALALTLFLFGIAQINLVGPLRDLRQKASVRKIGLPFALESQFGTALAWPFLSIAVAFGAPVIPMLMFTLNVEGNLAEVRIIWIGLTLMGILVGGVTLVLGLQKLYQQLNGSQTIVEISQDVVKPGETFSALVHYTPGKLRTDAIQVKLVCRKTVIRSRGGNSGRKTETIVLFEIDIQPETQVGTGVWQKSWSGTVPENVDLSTALVQNNARASRIIAWSIDVIAHLPNAPDITENFEFMVDDPALCAEWETEE